MSTLLKIKQAYSLGEISKNAFIQAMYNEHLRLFDYVDWLSQTNISELRLGAGGIIAEFADPKVRMICPPADMRIAPIEAINFGDYEQDEIQIVRNVVEKLGGVNARFLDIGANAGYYSLALNYYFPGIVGIAFEPIPTTFSYLERNLKLNSVKGIKAVNTGLSDKDGELVFYTYPSQSGSSSMTFNVESPDVTEVRCVVSRLDDFCDTNGFGVDFIKCDVEGAELRVFEGARNTLVSNCPVVFTEMLRKWCAKHGYHPNDIIAFFGDLGYKCFGIHAGKLNPCEFVTMETVETNYLFLHTERHAEVISSQTLS